MAERWALASDVSSPKPQIVLLKAERGIGKTRLAMEFYQWLREHGSPPASAGYWPALKGSLQRSIDVNPDPYACSYDLDIPFLWWGMRASDIGGENSISGDAISTYDRFLAPHLVALTMRARAIQSGKAILGVWGDVLKGEAASWSGYDTVMSVGEGILKTIGILRGAIHRGSASARDLMAGRSVSRIDAILEDLETVFNPSSMTYAKTPGVILIDDAQFASDDPGLTVFCERLLHMATSQSWPLLIVATHWKRDLSPEFVKSERSFAGVYHHGRNNAAAHSPGPAAGLPGGYLNAGNTLEIDLAPVPDLSAPLREAMPGLLPKQAVALLEHAGGNPRHLEQIIAFLRENEDFFEDFDPKGPLTEEGLAETLEETHDLFKVVMRRLRDAPVEVQEAICLASLQGVRFVTEIVNDLAKVFLAADRSGALRKAIDPFSMVSSRESETIAEFSERLFYLVAEKRRRSLKGVSDEVALTNALKELLRARLKLTEIDQVNDIDTAAISLGLAAQTFGSSEPKAALDALSKLARLEQGRHSYEAAVRAAERFHETFIQAAEPLKGLDAWLVGNVAVLLMNEGRADEASAILVPLLDHCRSAVAEERTEGNLRDLSVTLNRAGDAALNKGGLAAARELIVESLAICREMTGNSRTLENLDDLAVALDGKGDVAAAEGDLDDAADAREECLAICRELAASARSQKTFLMLTTALDKAGEVAMDQGDPAAARKVWNEKLGICRDLASRQRGFESRSALARALDRVGDAMSIEGNPNGAAEAWEESLAIRRELVAALQTPDSLYELTMSLSRAGSVALTNADHAASRTAYSECLDICRNLASRAATPQNLRHMSVMLNKAGIAELSGGGITAARDMWDESLGICRKLIAGMRTPENLEALSKALDHAGNGAFRVGDLPAAQNLWTEGLKVHREVHDLMKSPSSLRRLTSALDQVGDVEKDMGNIETAMEAFSQSLSVRRDLVAWTKSNLNMRDLSISLSKVGEIARMIGDLAAAKEINLESVTVHRDLADLLQTPESMRNLAISLDRVVDVALVEDDLLLAKSAAMEGLSIRRDLVRQKQNHQSMRDLSLSLERIGDVALAEGEPVSAVEAWNGCLAIRRDLAAEMSGTEHMRDVSLTLNRIGEASLAEGRLEAAKEALEEALAIRRELYNGIETPRSLQDLCLGIYNCARFNLVAGQTVQASTLVDEGSLLANSLPERSREAFAAAFDGLKESLSES